ncbi:MAG: GspH/FimT family pseudopilin [Desulfatibacillum sp.]|nr:GspH/FimT family pseudopilin [Desulfatibacillum sp.]
MKNMGNKEWNRIIRSRQGFTLIEAIVVLLIMGIVSAVIVSQASMSLDSTVVAEAEALKSQFRYAQRRAMTTGDSWGIQISGNSYTMFNYDGTRTNVAMPGATDMTKSLGALGITVTGATVSFDSWGRPCSGETGVTALASNLSLTVTKGSKSKNITITKNTGFIP